MSTLVAAQGSKVLAVDPQRYRAAAAGCRERSPGLAFASFFLPRPQRHAVHCVHAVCQQLVDILTPHRHDASGGGGGGEEKDDACKVERDAGRCPTPGACESGCQGGGESLQERRAVCSAVLEYLFAGRETKRADLDGFHAAVTHYGLPRDRFEHFADGLAGMVDVRRYATWQRLRDDLERTAGACAELAWSIVAGHDDDFAAPTVHTQINALGVASAMTRLLSGVARDWKADHLRLPLADLVKFNLTDRDVGSFVAAGTTERDVRWDEMMTMQIDRVRSLLRGAARAIVPLRDARCRRAVAVCIAVQAGLLNQLERAGRDPIATRIRSSRWLHMRQLPLAFRLSNNPSRAAGAI